MEPTNINAYLLNLFINALDIDDDIRQYYANDVSRITNSLKLSYEVANAKHTRTAPATAIESVQEYYPVTAGISGEQQIYDLLISAKYNCELVAKQDFVTDIILHVDQGDILIEIKNYTRTVPSKEITKFYRDIDMQRNIVGAMFISLQSPITGHGMITFKNEWTDNPLIIILACANTDTILDLVQLLVNYVRGRHNMGLDMDQINKNISRISTHNNNLLLVGKLIHQTKCDVIKNLDNINNIVIESEMNIRMLVREIRDQTVYYEPVTQSLLTKDKFFDHNVSGIARLTTYAECLRYVLDTVSSSNMLIMSTNSRDIILSDWVNIKFRMLKSKVIISVQIDVPMVIPTVATYKDGWVSFDFTSKKKPIEECIGLINQMKLMNDE